MTKDKNGDFGIAMDSKHYLNHRYDLNISSFSRQNDILLKLV